VSPLPWLIEALLVPARSKRGTELLFMASPGAGDRPTPSPGSDHLKELHELLEAGKVTPVVDRTFPLSDVPDAIRYLREGCARGKVIITV
jgi:NADPH:quinone reductase-like Zn-dependent oxidoreductase